MDHLRTEEEQIAALKNWWKENGNSLLIGIGAALFILFGWQAYKKSVIEEKTEASLMYQQLVTAASQPFGMETQSDETTIAYLAEELKDKHGETEYGLYAGLFLAKDAVDKDNLEGAIEQLDWVASSTEDSRIQHIVNSRKARILSAQGKHEDALALLSSPDAAFSASYREIEGDIKARMGDEAGAIEAYKKAFALVKDMPQAQPLLAVKLSNLGVNPSDL